MIETLIFSILSIIIGLSFCFAGWTYFRILFPIWGFVIGMAAGVNLMTSLAGPGFLVTAMGLVIGLFIGTMFALLSTFVYKLAVVLYGATIGYALGAGIWMLFGLNAPFLAFITGMIGAFIMISFFLALNMPRSVMIVTTAMAGAMAATTGFLGLFGQVPPADMGLAFANDVVQSSIFWTFAWLVLTGLGIITQSQMSRQEDMAKMLVWEDVIKELQAGKSSK